MMEDLRHASRTSDFIDGFTTPLRSDDGLSATSDAALVAERVDGLARSGLVDPSYCLPQEISQLFDNPSRLFAGGLDGITQTVSYTRGNRSEYASLVVAQLRSKRVVLTTRPLCSANISVVPKRGTERLREVWDGSHISDAAFEPLMP